MLGLKSTLIGCACSLLSWRACSNSVDTEGDQRPNPLCVVVDDLNVALSTYGESPTGMLARWWTVELAAGARGCANAAPLLT